MRRILTDRAIKNAKPNDGGKQKKYNDGGGLYLLVKASGGSTSKLWRYKYRVSGKEKVLAIGSYHETSLKAARAIHEQPKGVDPSAHKQHLKAAKAILEQDSFEAVAREWFIGHSVNWTAGHANRVIVRLENDVFPWLGNVPIATIEPPDILKCLRRVEGRGALETSHRIKQTIGQVFHYAVATGKAKRDQN